MNSGSRVATFSYSPRKPDGAVLILCCDSQNPLLSSTMLAQLKGIEEHSTKAVIASIASLVSNPGGGEYRQGRSSRDMRRSCLSLLCSSAAGSRHSLRCTLAPLVVVHIGSPGLGYSRLEVCYTCVLPPCQTSRLPDSLLS